jgi:HSP20 family protein
MARKSSHEPNTGSDAGTGGIFRSLGGFIDLLTKLTEQGGGEWTKSGEVGEDKKGVKAVYGFSVRVGGGAKPSIEQFGNVKDDGRKAVVEETREPMVDIFDEDDHLAIVAELPGVDAEDIRYELKDDILNLSAAHGEKKYRKEILLPAAVMARKATSSYRNGIFELNLPKTRKS